MSLSEIKMEDREWVFVLDIPLMNEYWGAYKKEHPKARVHPLKANGKVVNLAPYPISQNVLRTMEYPQLNSIKQKWSDFVIWWVGKLGYENLQLKGVEVYIEFYFGDLKSRDISDNYNLKFINDGFVRSGFLKDDNCKFLQNAHYLYKGIDREHPRTVIRFVKLKEEEIVE